MQQTINASVQNNLNKLERDCRMVNTRIEELLSADRIARTHNRKAASYGWLVFAVSLLAPLIMVALLLHRSGVVTSLADGAVPPAVIAAFGDTCDALVTPHPLEDAEPHAAAVDATDSAIGEGTAIAPPVAVRAAAAGGMLSLPQFLLGGVAFFLVGQLVSKTLRRYEPSYSKRELANLLQTQKYVTHDLLELKGRLYKTYLDECSSDPSGMQ